MWPTVLSLWANFTLSLFKIKSLRVFENFLFLLIFGQFGGFAGGGVCLVVHGFSETFALVSPYFDNGLLFTNLNSCLSMKTLYFLHSLQPLEKLKKWYTFKSCTEERFWFLTKLEISQKRKVILYVSSGSVLPLLRKLSSQFAAILVYAQFLSLPSCDVIYVWSLMVNMILKMRNIISIFAVFQILQNF